MGGGRGELRAPLRWARALITSRRDVERGGLLRDEEEQRQGRREQAARALHVCLAQLVDDLLRVRHGLPALGDFPGHAHMPPPTGCGEDRLHPYPRAVVPAHAIVHRRRCTGRAHDGVELSDASGTAGVSGRPAGGGASWPRWPRREDHTPRDQVLRMHQVEEGHAEEFMRLVAEHDPRGGRDVLEFEGLGRCVHGDDVGAMTGEELVLLERG